MSDNHEHTYQLMLHPLHGIFEEAPRYLLHCTQWGCMFEVALAPPIGVAYE